MTENARLKLSTRHLYPLILLAGFATFVSLVPVESNDFWWHLKAGELIYTQRSIPTMNLFSWTLPADTPFTYAAWLGELLFYILFRIGQLELVIFARNFMAVTAIALIGWEARRKSGSWVLAALAIGLLSAMSVNNLTIRPQIWAWLPFALFLMILNRVTDRQFSPAWLLLCAPLMAFWVNVHGSFITGGVLLGIFFVGEGLRTLALPKENRNWRVFIWLFGAGLLSGAAMLASPFGFRIFGYVANLLSDAPSQQLIIEWQSPTPTGIANITFFASILLFIALLVYTAKRPGPTALLLYLSFLWLAWTGMRYVIWFGMVSLPIMMELIAALPIRLPQVQTSRNAINNILAAALLSPLILVQPWFVEKIPFPDTYWTKVLRASPAGPLVSAATPVGAVEYLKRNPGGKIFNEMGYGSYMIWAIPEQPVFIDPRVELYPYAQWEDYIQIIRGVEYNRLLDAYGADRLLLDKELTPRLIAVLVNDARWQLEYEDPRSQVWNRTSP
jgi:hypothetical protein